MTDQEQIEALEREVLLLRRGLEASVVMIIETLGVHQKGKEDRERAFEQIRASLESVSPIYAKSRQIGQPPAPRSGGVDE